MIIWQMDKRRVYIPLYIAAADGKLWAAIAMPLADPLAPRCSLKKLYLRHHLRS